jgi:hypothetical protein
MVCAGSGTRLKVFLGRKKGGIRSALTAPSLGSYW